jgi:putative hydrolase of the HAD superfamily
MVEILSHEIKLIVFDYGGVIIDLYPEKTRSAFLDLGLRNPDELYSPSGQVGLFDDFDKGLIEPNEFLKELKKYFPSTVETDKIVDAWNAMLGNISTEKINFIRQLKEKYQVCLLSNTNEIHLEYIQSKNQPSNFSNSVEENFDKVYYSCRLGMRKPEKEIFEYVMNKHNVNPREILFIDDTPMHIEGANKCGWKTLKVERNENWFVKLYQCLAIK